MLNLFEPIEGSAAVFKQISGMLNTALLMVVIVLLVTGIGLDHGVVKTLEALDHIGSFLAGIAGLTAVGIGILGFDVWKRQITHGKYLTLIWEAMVAMHRLEAHTATTSMNLLFRNQSESQFFKDAVDEDLRITKKLMEELKTSCAAVDTLAARNGVELSNLCVFWDARMMAVYRFGDSPVELVTQEQFSAWSDGVAGLVELAEAEAKLLKQKLSALEQKYS